MMRRWAVLALLGVSCNDLPAVAPERFACVADTVAVDGAYECPASHYCANSSCTCLLYTSPDHDIAFLHTLFLCVRRKKEPQITQIVL